MADASPYDVGGRCRNGEHARCCAPCICPHATSEARPMLTADTLRALVAAHAKEEALRHEVAEREGSGVNADVAPCQQAETHAHRGDLLAFVRAVAELDPAHTVHRYGDSETECYFCDGEPWPSEGKSIKVGDLCHAATCLWLISQAAKESAESDAELRARCVAHPRSTSP